MMRVDEIDKSSSPLLPVGQFVFKHCSFFLSLCQHRVAPLKPHLAQENIDGARPNQEAQREGPCRTGTLHLFEVPSANTMFQLQHVYKTAQLHEIDYYLFKYIHVC